MIRRLATAALLAAVLALTCAPTLAAGQAAATPSMPSPSPPEPPSAPSARPSSPETIQAAARVASVTDERHLVVARGRVEGMTVGTAVTIYPVRAAEGKKPEPELEIELGAGRVTRATEHEATIELDAPSREIQPGDMAHYRVAVPPAWHDDVIYTIGARDMRLLSTAGEPLYTFTALCADPSAKTRGAVMDALVGEVASLAERAAEVYTKRIDGGRFHGQSLGEAFKATGPAEIESFLHYLEAYGGSFSAVDRPLGETYGSWIVSGAPDAQRDLAEFKASPEQRRGDEAASTGDFATAEEAYRAAMAILPGDENLRAKLDRVVAIRQRRERLAKDPDDTGTRWDQALALYSSEALDLALAEIELLDKAGFDADRCLRYRGYIAVRKGRFADGARFLRALAARLKEKDADLDGWVRYAEARARLVAEPDSFEARLAIARVHEEDKHWSDAATAYRDAAKYAKTEQDAKTAAEGTDRIAALREADRLTERAKEQIGRHQLGSDLNETVNALVASCKKVDVTACIMPRVATLAERARVMFESELAIGLLEARTSIDPESATAFRDLAYAQQDAGRYTDARKSVDRALELDPKSEYALTTRARAKLYERDLAGAAKDAGAAMASDPKYAWPAQVAAQVAAASGDWENAARLVTIARDLEPEGSERQRIYSAIQLGRFAAGEIAAGRNVPRNRLRLCRAFARMEMFSDAQAEAAKLEGSPFFKDAHWAIAEVDSSHVALDVQLRSISIAAPATPAQKVREEVLLARKAVKDDPQSPAGYLRLGRAWIVAGGFNHALAEMSALAWSDDPEAQDVAEAARRGNAAWEAYTAADAALRREDRATAERLFGEVAAAYERIGSTSDELSALFMRAIALTKMPGRQKDALAVYATVMAKAEAYGSGLVYHATNNMRTRLLADRGTVEPLVAAVEAAAAFYEADDNITNLVQTLSSKSYLASDAGHVKEAIEIAAEGLRFARMCGDRVTERGMLFALGDHHYSAGHNTEALRIAEQALSFSRAARDPVNERQALILLGAIEMAMGNAKSALPHLEEMYELGRRAGSSPDRALARLFQGRALLYLVKDPKAAVERFAQAAEIYAGLDDGWNEARALMGQGEARVALADAAGAREVLTRVRERYREMKRRTDEAYAAIELAHAEILGGRGEQALAAASFATDVATTTDIPDLRWQAAYAQACALEKLGRKEEAAAAYDRAVLALAEEMGTSTSDGDREGWLSFGRRRDVFRKAIDLMILLGRVDRAMEIAQLSRDAQMRAKLGPREVQAQSPALKETLDGVGDAEARAKAAQKALNEELSKPEDQRDQDKVKTLSEVAAKSEGELRQLLLRLKRDHRRLYSMLAFSPESVGELRDTLPDDVLVVQYFITEDATYVFTMRKERTRTKALKVPVKAGDLGDAVFEFVGAVKAEVPRAVELGGQLYDWLLAPIEDEMASARTTLIVPFGGLHYLPFHALGKKDAKGEVRYAIERFRIGYLSSTTLFKLQKAQRGAAEGALLAFANPDGSLPGARAEMERVVAEGYRSAKVLYEKDALKTRFFELAGSFRILHFATHGIVTTDPAASFLKMSDSELTVNEIMGYEGLEGRTDLVVLSACQTAMEKGQSTEDEPISIASAFATAGAPTLVASLWSVDDEATSELMRRFYAGLQQRKGDLDTLEALRKAQLGVMSLEVNGGRPFAAPRYWAAFELVGDYR